MSQSHNPYTPPKTDVSPATGTEPRPRAVDMALVLIAIILCLSLLAAIRTWPLVSQGAVSGLDMLWRLATLVIVTGICFAIARGRNWARIVLLVFAALDLFALGVALWQSSRYPVPFMLLFDAVQIGMLVLPSLLYIGAIYLLFVPARAWFASRA